MRRKSNVNISSPNIILPWHRAAEKDQLYKCLFDIRDICACSTDNKHGWRWVLFYILVQPHLKKGSLCSLLCVCVCVCVCVCLCRRSDQLRCVPRRLG